MKKGVTPTLPPNFETWLSSTTILEDFSVATSVLSKLETRRDLQTFMTSIPTRIMLKLDLESSITGGTIQSILTAVRIRYILKTENSQ